MQWTNGVRAIVIAMLLTMGGVAQATYWSLFNIEGESSLSAQYVTYGSLGDMLADSNRLGVFTPNPAGFGVNIVGSGSDEMRATNPVPEPASLALVGLALAGLVCLSRRQPIST